MIPCGERGRQTLPPQHKAPYLDYYIIYTMRAYVRMRAY